MVKKTKPSRKYILVTGTRYADPDRHWDEICKRLGQAVRGWPDARVEIVCGDAPGVDSLALRWADLHGIRRKPGGWKAHWDKDGPSAGPRRNTRMVSYCVDQVERGDSEAECIGFPAANAESRGTCNCITTAKHAGLVTREFKLQCEPAIIDKRKKRYYYR